MRLGGGHRGSNVRFSSGAAMQRAKVECIAFDLDGTLVDSFPALRRGYDSFLKSFGFAGNDEEFARLNGPAMSTVVELLKDWRSLPGSAAELLSAYHEHVEQAYRAGIPAMPGAEALLDLAQRQGWSRALVTSSPRRVVKAVLAGLGWERTFDALACGDEVPRSKPAPDIYELACRRVGWPPAACVAIEDAEAGVAAAKACGLRAIGVGSTMPIARLAQAGADWVIGELGEAAEILERLSQNE